ncbi:MAG: hypothetical protein QNJ46_20920 [Leptolyngbyaceae cyanobacterium MO_188.B28]|nr:hypothetical protein [Leptolyngbyaceae cyanobacterium MO_188.B28]
MCFSAAASFTATAILVPAGIYASKIARNKDPRYLPLAIFPLAFGIQQGLEGLAWLGLEGNQADLVWLGARGFLLFSHGFWMVWPALTAYALESRPWAKKLLLAIALIGFLFGVSLCGPFLTFPDWLSVAVTQGSIDYQLQIIYDRFFPRDISRLIYMLIALGPLWLSNLTPLRLMGGLIALLAVITYWLFNYAFVSVWCFWAAVVSLYVAYIFHSVFFSDQPA